jgi:glutamate 5-kinase
VGGLLLTHADITDYDARKKTLIDTVKRDWENNILPIANENDPIATEEMIALKR